MNLKRFKIAARIYAPLIGLLLFSACANRGVGPQGGPKDTIPPSVLKEIPVSGSLNVQSKEIEITFDEYIQLADIQNNVLISPPQQTQPEIKAIGKKLSVVFQEDLQDSTTYTVDFGAAICDYNEKIPLQGYVFSFSTGDHIDSLTIAGRVYNAADLNPVSSVLVGIHANHNDSALTTNPFNRVARSNDEGYFTIHNIRKGNYRLYALNDISRDYIYQPGEGLAFTDSIFTPMAIDHVHTDTMWIDTLGINLETGDTLFTRLVDTVHVHKHTQYTPDSIVIWYFEESKQRHYFQRLLRDQQHAFTLIFSAPQDSLPTIQPLKYSQVDSLTSDSGWVNFLDYTLIQANKTNDTIMYWLTDSLAIKMDTIPFCLTYQYSDSLYNIVPKTDTLSAIYRHPKLSDKARETYEKNKRMRMLNLKTNASTKFEIYDTLFIQSDFPIDSLDQQKIHFVQVVDTNIVPITYQIQPLDSIKRNFGVIAQLKPNESYKLTIDSAAMVDIYGATNNKEEKKLKLKSLEDYSSLLVKMAHYDSLARIQLLNEKDVVIYEKPASEQGTLFQYLAPEVFYLRLYIDINQDGQWTTGDWLLHRQPEPVYYYPAKLKLRANWDFEETFDHLALPQTESKPKSLISTGKKK
jgi:hypothetical protein